MLPSSIFSSTTIPVLEQVVNFTQARQTVLAGNLANFDTPGYRVRDLSPQKFETRLREAIDARDRQHGSAADCCRENLMASASQDLAGILYHDESNQSIEQQVTAMSKNQARHNTAIAIMSSQFRLLQVAISERV